MPLILKSFRGLYFATLMMLLGSGLLSTYLALRLSTEVDGIWVGGLMAAYYCGLVLGGKTGHRLIARVGHIRAYVACAGMVMAAVLLHGLIDWLPAWLLLRFAVGIGMMCQYMVLESWLNEQAGADQRGTVFGAYMAVSYLGLVLGQLVLVVYPALGLELLMLVALCFALCLVPVALTHKLHPAPLRPAPLEPRFFFRRVPQSLTTIAVSGLVIGAFYGLAPLYAKRQGLTTDEIGLFMGSCVLAGLLVQWPLGWLSDRHDRAWLIRLCAMLLALFALPLALMPTVPLPVLLPLGFLLCLLQFSLYPLAVAFANDHVEPERRVSLTAMLLATFGVGACIGPLLAGVLMKYLGGNMLYAFDIACALILVWRIQPKAVTRLYQVENAPLHHIPSADNMTSSPLLAALDPRVDEALVHEQMQQKPETLAETI
ncbi:MFS transporter [Azotobacter bryophylli]|uniref:MFS transporter n=1 Tax=Azotobacter bryophylli TaxID=1986537 RepID=A0ABV7AVA8_9GAMM